jgi:hypothetical protein
LKFLNGPQNVRLFRRRLRTDIYKPLSWLIQIRSSNFMFTHMHPN